MPRVVCSSSLICPSDELPGAWLQVRPLQDQKIAARQVAVTKNANKVVQREGESDPIKSPFHVANVMDSSPPLLQTGESLFHLP